VAETKASVVPEKPATRARGMPELPTTSEFSGQITWVDAQGVFWLRPDSKVTIHKSSKKAALTYVVFF
jgi:hypothetical protein